MLGVSTRADTPLRVGYVLKRFPRLSETFILNEIAELERQGVEVEVFSLLRPPEEARHHLLSTLCAPVTYLPGGSAAAGLQVKAGPAAGEPRRVDVVSAIDDAGPRFDALLAGKTPRDACHLMLQASTLALLASSRRLGHLHAHFGSNATTVALLASRLSGIPFSYTAHARDIYHTYVNELVDARMRRLKLAEARFVVTVSEYNRRHLDGLAGPSGANVIRLYNGIDLQRFRPGGAAGGGGLILAVGRLIEKKGFPDLVRACARLRDQGIDFRCRIIGEGPDRAALEAQIAELDLCDRFELPGALAQERVIESMREASLVVLPCVVSASGDRDGLPTVLLEALAMGVPAISTRVAGVPEIIEDGVSGLLVPPGRPAALADAMARVLRHPSLAGRLGRGGREKAEREFDLRRNVARLRALFEGSVVGESLEGGEDENRVRLG